MSLFSQVNQTVSLTCSYDLAGEGLYSVKWYKVLYTPLCSPLYYSDVQDQLEFYRFLPRDLPPALAFPVPGTAVNLDKYNSLLLAVFTGGVCRSDERSVSLENLQLGSSGMYQCEVRILGVLIVFSGSKT